MEMTCKPRPEDEKKTVMRIRGKIQEKRRFCEDMGRRKPILKCLTQERIWQVP